MKEGVTILLAGGIGSGKSALSGYLAERGVPVYDCDSCTKALYDGELGLAVEKEMGVQLRGADGKFDRKALAALIFSDGGALARLESIVHPAVLADFCRWRTETLSGLSWRGYLGDVPFVCMESAIALDKPLFDGSYDVSVFVDADEDVRVARACARDACGEDAVRRRIRNQNADPSRADYVISNNGTPSELAAAADEVFGRIMKDMNN